MSVAVPRNAFPLVVTAVAFTFLGLFLIYPLYRVFGASFLDASGTNLTLHNYAKVVSSTFYRSSVINSLTIGVLATIATTLISAPLAFCSHACQSAARQRYCRWRFFRSSCQAL